MYNDEYLSHYGVPGMKWGVRKKKSFASDRKERKPRPWVLDGPEPASKPKIGAVDQDGWAPKHTRPIGAKTFNGKASKPKIGTVDQDGWVPKHTRPSLGATPPFNSETKASDTRVLEASKIGRELVSHVLDGLVLVKQ